MDLPASIVGSLTRPKQVTAKDQFTCDQCGARFRKLQHLMRHARRHLQDRPHKCPFCSKSFQRKDSLKRHVGIHGKEASSIYATRAAAESTRAAHACRECSTSKKRCDGLDPCSQCARKGQTCIYDCQNDRRTAVHREHARVHPGTAPEGGETGNYAAWLPYMSASDHPSDVEGSITTPSIDISQPANTSCDGIVDAAVNSSGIYNNSELNRPSRWSQQDPALDLMFDPFIFWGSQETAGLLDNPLPNDSVDVAAHTTHGEGPVLLPYSPHSGDTDQGDRSTRTCQISASVGQLAGKNTEASRIATVGQMREQASSVVGLADLTVNDRDILVSEQYYHVPPISEGVYNNIYASYLQHSDLSQLQAFPDAEILNTFMQMYFEFCHEELSLFHLPTFAPSPESWIVVAAIIAVGCNYSVSHYRQEVSETILMLLHRVMSQKITDNSLLDGDLPLAQGIFLLNLCQMFHGTREEFLKLQYQRNMLITLCRLHMAQTSSIFNAKPGLDDDSSRDTWKAWIREESWRRLVYSTWMLECFQWILFDTQPILAVWELRLSLPCHEDIWKCATQSQWEQLASTQTSVTEPSLATIMNTSSGLTGTIRSLGSFASAIAMLSFSVEEKRQWNSQGYGIYHLISNPYLNAQSKLLGNESGFHLQASGIAPQRQKLFLLLSILQNVPLRVLFRASGWLTSSKDRDAAQRELSSLFNNNRSAARRTLRRAACLFRLIRMQRKMSYCDPQMFLIATLYIWFCVEISGGFRNRHDFSSSSSSLGGWLDRPLRIDQEVDEEALEEWIANGDQGRRVHITSVGILQTRDSRIRLLQESIRVLRHETAWARIGRGIAQALERILESGTTSFDGQGPHQETIV
ncbi:fungal-specific transcription factor domain-containing protein [Aspergillus sergii]|uniref:Fungal-specific transcription factor domain-containing protein n=1 Tax=Aspergillus sergii TaxID=1034303 RepID=A0A5N6WXL6_9EURO|nr:fungal-specific transcription factor domain-containing protein [Aspergillus sergii]